MPTTLSAVTADVTGFPLTRPLVNGKRIGSFFPVLGASFTTAGTDVTISVNLGRQPSGYLQIRTPPGGGVITDGTNLGSDWTPSSIVVQATVAGTYSLLVF